MLVGNWSVSQPSNSSPVLASIEPERACGAGDFEFVLHRVAGERGVIGFDVQLEVVQQVVFAQEIQARGGVGIVLMLGRFLGLRLDVELAFEADLLLVIDGHVQELGEMFQLALHVGVQQRGVTFAAAPEDVADAAEFVRDFHRLLHLGGGIGEDVGIAARGRAVHEARIAKTDWPCPTAV